MFDAIAFRYDALNHLLSMGVDRSWRRKVVRRVHAAKPATILDLATGTGDLAIMLARKCPQSAVTGIDLSEQMLAIGRQKVSQAGLEQRITLMQGDAENLPAEDNSFDAVTVAFGVRNFEDIARRVAERTASCTPAELSAYWNSACPETRYSVRCTVSISTGYSPQSDGCFRTTRAPIHTCRNR